MPAIANLKPARGMVLVKPNPKAEISAGGIIMPEPKRTKDKIGVENGVVLLCGLPMHHKKTGLVIPWLIRQGDTVFYTWTAGTEVQAREGKFLLLLHNELIAYHP